MPIKKISRVARKLCFAGIIVDMRKTGSDIKGKKMKITRIRRGGR